MGPVKTLLIACAIAALLPGAALAQLTPPENERGIAFEFAASGSFPLGATENRFNPGAGFLLGVGYDFSKTFGLLAEYSLTWFDVKSSVLPQADINGNQLIQSGTAQGLLNLVNTENAGFYLIAGAGIYFRRVEITRFAGTAVSSFCDPWLLVCFPTAVPVEDVLGSVTSTDFGVNAGLGGFLRLGPTVKLFLEARYQYIWGGDVDTPAGPRSSNAQFLPINFGIRI
ncbi:MAG: outer membrane beta-barrel protein [Myxococcales bacterium]|jgi:opacity protein-like surface antigen